MQMASQTLMNDDDPFALSGEPLPKPKRLRGVGDVVHLLAKPIALASDHLLGTDLQNCQSCANRREDWNEKYHFSQKKD